MEKTGMDILRDKSRVKSLSWLARQLGITRGAVGAWDKVPANRMKDVSDITGIPLKALRPDIFESKRPTQ